MNSFLKSCTALTIALTFAGQAVAQEALKELGKGEGALNIVAWPGYVERGETDKAYDWVTDFEKETGCKVTVKYVKSKKAKNTVLAQSRKAGKKLGYKSVVKLTVATATATAHRWLTGRYAIPSTDDEAEGDGSEED